MGFEYSIKRSTRSRKIKIAVVGERVIVTAPKRAGLAYLDEVVRRHKDWIERNLTKQQKLLVGTSLVRETVDRKDFLRTVKTHAEKYHRLISAPAGARLNKVSVRKMRSRWGSCSRDGNISINLLLGHLPNELLEYVIVHELCHLVHHNHSKTFWLLVAKYLPDHKSRKRELRRYGHLLKVSDETRMGTDYMVK